MTTEHASTEATSPKPPSASSLKLHVSLDVNNIEDSVRFYSALFDMQPTKVRLGYAKFDADFPSVNLALNEREHCCLQGVSHMGIRVPSLAEIDSAKARLNGAGFKTQDEMGSTCCSALQDKVWAEDPSGYRWEVYVFHGDLEAEDHGANGEVAAKCCA